MKKLLAALSVSLCLLPACALSAFDLSAMTTDDLVALRDQVSDELSRRGASSSVTVPIGVWRIGEDIPAGTWMLSAIDDRYTHIVIGPTVDPSGLTMDKYASGNSGFFLSRGDACRVTLCAGDFLFIESCPVTFSPASSFTLDFAKDDP